VRPVSTRVQFPELEEARTVTETMAFVLKPAQGRPEAVAEPGSVVRVNSSKAFPYVGYWTFVLYLLE